MKLPKKTSLVIQTAESIEEGIHSRLWGDRMPGERALSLQLRVSRSTLRGALALLMKKGLLGGENRRRRTIHFPQTALQRRVSKDLVVVVANEQVQLMAPLVIYYINELRRHLQRSGLRLEIFSESHPNQNEPNRKLREFTQDRHVACWLLVAPSERLQGFFAEQGFPTIVIGPCAREIPLPSIFVDYQSVCRHAAGVLLGKGHRRISLVLPSYPNTGNRLSEAGFKEGFLHGGHADSLAVVLRHDSTLEGICRKIDSQLKSSRPVTAFLVCRSPHALTVVSHLLKTGVRVPDEISVISRDSESYLDFFTPKITRYHHGRRLFAQKLVRLVMNLAEDGSLPIKRTLILPELLPGQTLAPAPGFR